MTGDEAAEVDDLVSGAVVEVPDLETEGVSHKTDFLPWHLPRKQLCRYDQWLKSIDRLRRELYGGRDPGHTFRYLSLPGDDLLDVRVIARAFSAAPGPQLSFLGFNAMGGAGGRRSESNLSLNEVRAMPEVYTAGTAVLDQRIEEVGDETSVGFRAFTDRAPFDAINLDLTASAIGEQPLSASSVVQAIHNIIDEQANRRREPWLLFLTTPIGHPPLIDDDALRQLHAPLKVNVRNDEFRNKMTTVLDLPDGIVPEDLDTVRQLDHAPYARLVGLALSKWLLGLVCDRPDGWELSLLSLYVYRVSREHPDMFSFAFRFDPVPAHGSDKTGLTIPLGEPRADRTELEIADSLLDAMQGTTDADVLLRDPDLLNEALELSEQLLLSARYDVSGYRDWVSATMQAKGLD